MDCLTRRCFWASADRHGDYQAIAVLGVGAQFFDAGNQADGIAEPPRLAPADGLKSSSMSSGLDRRFWPCGHVAIFDPTTIKHARDDVPLKPMLGLCISF